MNLSFLTTGAAAGGQGSPVTMILLMVGMFAIMYFVMIRPQKKRQKEEQEMRSAVDVGDEITTIGGICGRVVTVKEEHLIIETGAAANERLAAERAAAKEAAEKAKAEKLAAKGKKPKEKKSKKED